MKLLLRQPWLGLLWLLLLLRWQRIFVRFDVQRHFAGLQVAIYRSGAIICCSSVCIVAALSHRRLRS